MEYFLGSVITLVIVSIFGFLINKTVKEHKQITIHSSQSYFISLMGSFLYEASGKNKKLSQSQKYEDSMHIKVFITRDKAYWISDNKVLVADVIDASVDEDSAVEVDIMGMDHVQLKEMLFIIDKLKEDSYNDNWNAG